jgi:UDP-N-acetyl-L-fucosamine synthase
MVHSAPIEPARLKVMTILGTRPEIIRLSRVIALLDATVDHVLVHTGQNYDHELSAVFFEDLGVRPPDRYLDVDTSSLGATLGGILTASEAVLRAERPDAVLILGDTNSALAAIMARRMKVPVFHMEAGNRSFDRNVPEETNRKIVDHIADFNLVYTEHARRHLLSEGLPHRRIYLTGSPMREVLEHARAAIAAATVLERLGLAPDGYVVASLHREENVDDPARLGALLGALDAVAARYAVPVIVSTHPRTRKRMEALGRAQLDERVRFLTPLGFHDYNHLQWRARCTISDSGTIAEEASILGFPAVTPRDAIERPEGLDVGCVVMTGTDAATILAGVDLAVARFARATSAGTAWPVPDDYRIVDTSERVVNLIVGATKLSNAWDGIRSWPGHGR